MSSFIAIAWLVSAPVLFFLGAHRQDMRSLMWTPTSRSSRMILAGVGAACAMAAFHHLLFGPFLVLGTPTLVWSGLVFLCAIWWRFLDIRLSTHLSDTP